MTDVITVEECPNHLALIITNEQAALIHMLVGTVTASYGGTSDLYFLLEDVLVRTGKTLNPLEWVVVKIPDESTRICVDSVLITKGEE